MEKKATCEDGLGNGVNNMIPANYYEKVYAGLLGMNIGVRLGAPVEPSDWTFEKIEHVYGEIKGYVKDYKTFGADDDVNGPVHFIRALYDDAVERELEAEDVGKAWMNYTREGIGMFWWGGEGISTEHTAYLNLKKGIKPPESGSALTNGYTIAEQIGGQIFVDTWGLVLPNQVLKAADYAEKAASVSHDRNGIYGARFIAACIASAFEAKSIEEIIRIGLSTLPVDSTYAKVAQATLQFYKNHPDDFRLCREYLEQEWGYDRYPGICHIIPNAGVCVLALLYGEGDFGRTVEIATMCGWDTDCNAGSVGTIIGVFVGIEGIPLHYRKPMNDFIATSGVSGYLNILDLPTFSREITLLGYRLAKKEAPSELVELERRGEVLFDFSLPGSTHGFKVDHPYRTVIHHDHDFGYKQPGSLEIVVDRMLAEEQAKVFYKPFYRREDFTDERYHPTFAPTAYSGQTVSFQVHLEQWSGEPIRITPYVHLTFGKKDVKMGSVFLPKRIWREIHFTIPDADGDLIDEIGFIIESDSSLDDRAFAYIHLDQFQIEGPAHYTIDFAKQSKEFKCVTPFSHHHGNWDLAGEYMSCVTEENCSSYSGNYYSKDAVIKGVIKPLSGSSHLLVFRAKGIQRHYLFGFDGKNRASLILNDFGYKKLITVPFEWEHYKEYRLAVRCKGQEICCFIDGVEMIHYFDSTIPSGMYGFAMLEKGENLIGTVEVREI